jgi:hypothetical protein
MPMDLLRASNADRNDRFGETVALSCDASIVGGEPALKHDTTTRGRRLGSIGGNLRGTRPPEDRASPIA